MRPAVQQLPLLGMSVEMALPAELEVLAELALTAELEVLAELADLYLRFPKALLRWEMLVTVCLEAKAGQGTLADKVRLA